MYNKRLMELRKNEQYYQAEVRELEFRNAPPDIICMAKENQRRTQVQIDNLKGRTERNNSLI